MLGRDTPDDADFVVDRAASFKREIVFVDVGSLGVFFGVVDLFGLSNYLKNSVLSC